uniref:Prion protein n=1 Tax=Angiostrongylus cantonensis TaxID=6313 RepID=A0A0K0CVA9_ANGCA
MSQYYDPNSNSPTRYYDPVLNTNLGYPNQVQRDQNYRYGFGNTGNAYDGYNGQNGYNTQYGYYDQNRYRNGQSYSQQNGYANPQSWCCGPTSTSCCYQTSSAMTQSYGRK